ncbi:MAG: NAD(P)/FAD-dependent oxidoreductase [Armatimonadetes bacterium]|nr:NAD(P)/FAD-dependent oxidoreductase [Armatimonadota bacterium]
MSPNQCEVAVIGGGLAGCSAAISLARAGADVALFEAAALPRHRVCGEFLSPESRATLERLGVTAQIAEAGARDVSLARFWCGAQSADFPLGEARGLSISRHALDAILWDAAQRGGARAHLEARVRGLKNDGGAFVFEANGHLWRAKKVIWTVGRAGAPKSAPAENRPRFFGLKAHFAGARASENVVEMHLFRGGYCGLVRVEGEAANVALLVDYPTLQKRAPDAFLAHLLSKNPTLAARFEGARRLIPWETTANVSFERFRPAGGNDMARGVLCAGDAAGYIHPLTGDGMAMALRAGELAAAVARAHKLSPREAARLYQAAWEREFAPRLRLAARLHPFALRPELARPLLPLVRRFPALGRAMVRGTRGT